MNLRRIQRGKERAGKGGEREPSRRQLLAGALGVLAGETLAKAAPA